MRPTAAKATRERRATADEEADAGGEGGEADAAEEADAGGEGDEADEADAAEEADAGEEGGCSRAPGLPGQLRPNGTSDPEAHALARADVPGPRGCPGNPASLEPRTPRRAPWRGRVFQSPEVARATPPQWNSVLGMVGSMEHRGQRAPVLRGRRTVEASLSTGRALRHRLDPRPMFH